MIREYHRPESIGQAVDLFRKNQGRALYMGGGAHINTPDSGTDRECAISLAGLGLETIAAGQDDLIIGACASLQSVADHPDMPHPLREAAVFLRSRHMRNQHTVGGDIAARKHDSFTTAALMALQATVQTADQGQMSVEEYVSGASDALILSVTVPAQGKRICALFRQTRAQRGPLLMNMAVGRDHDGGNPIIAVSGAGIGLTRLSETEALLASGTETEQVAKQAASEISPTGHWLGSDDYFRHLCGAALTHCIRQHA